MKSGQWYHGAKGHGMQRKGSLNRQSSFSSDHEARGGGRQSRDMTVGGAYKRSSSAHALMETDKMDENFTRNRIRNRIPSFGGELDKRNNGDVTRPIRLRGEMETTPFISPSMSNNRRTLGENISPAVSQPSVNPTVAAAAAASKFGSSLTSAMHKIEDVAASQPQMVLPNQSVKPSPSRVVTPGSVFDPSLPSHDGVRCVSGGKGSSPLLPDDLVSAAANK